MQYTCAVSHDVREAWYKAGAGAGEEPRRREVVATTPEHMEVISLCLCIVSIRMSSYYGTEYHKPRETRRTLKSSKLDLD